jgi:hypothetical protein
MIRDILIPSCNAGIWPPKACRTTSAALTDHFFSLGLSRVNRCRSCLDGSHVLATVTVALATGRSAFGRGAIRRNEASHRSAEVGFLPAESGDGKPPRLRQGEGRTFNFGFGWNSASVLVNTANISIMISSFQSIAGNVRLARKYGKIERAKLRTHRYDILRFQNCDHQAF